MQNTAKTKQIKRQVKHNRIRAKISGTKERPRLAVFKSNQHIYAQAIDDVNMHTLAACSDLEIKTTDKKTKTDKGIEVAKLLGEKLKQQKITAIVFDRGGFQYHGRVKAFAEELRKSGINF